MLVYHSKGDLFIYNLLIEWYNSIKFNNGNLR